VNPIGDATAARAPAAAGAAAVRRPPSEPRADGRQADATPDGRAAAYGARPPAGAPDPSGRVGSLIDVLA